MATNDWTADRLPDQSGKTAVVTGANGGLGYRVTRELAARGATVAMACRSEERGERARRRVRAAFPDADLDLLTLDLADLDSVRAFAGAFREAHDDLHVLVNNAGVMHTPYRRTADGFELQFGVNHLGHFALTGLLLDRLAATDGTTRVVTVSSLLHGRGTLRLDTPDEESYDRYEAYAGSKLANLLFAYELQRRFEAADLDALSLAAHPGWAATGLQRAGPEMEGNRLRARLMDLGNALFAQSAARGALPILYAAAGSPVEGGAFYGPRGPGPLQYQGPPDRVTSNAKSHDRTAARQLWIASENLTGVRYDFEGAKEAERAAR
ncbi:oxidoreductase [Halomarina halobia]|uniref:Oxidoreductase n=1 Tax=Halomarina halobia TaxID=3033386 RepID=A0ABD6ACK2_9EURY|nr:oxidoreductase [Halomarina sp. PSR21]